LGFEELGAKLKLKLVDSRPIGKGDRFPFINYALISKSDYES